MEEETTITENTKLRNHFLFVGGHRITSISKIAHALPIYTIGKHSGDASTVVVWNWKDKCLLK
jgi:hypothetical protein